MICKQKENTTICTLAYYVQLCVISEWFTKIPHGLSEINFYDYHTESKIIKRILCEWCLDCNLRNLPETINCIIFDYEFISGENMIISEIDIDYFDFFCQIYGISNGIKHKLSIFRICVLNFVKNRKTQAKIDKFSRILIDMVQIIINFNHKINFVDQSMLFTTFCDLIKYFIVDITIIN